MDRSSGALIRNARLQARLSQTDLARRVGIAQSVVSTYESDRREPGLRMLTKLLEATGHRLTLDLLPESGRYRGLPNTRLGRKLRRHRSEISQIAESKGARNLRVFGSVARDEETEKSDIDLLVDLSENVGLIGLASLRRELSTLLGVDVDVVPADSLKPYMRDEVIREAIAL